MCSCAVSHVTAQEQSGEGSYLKPAASVSLGSFMTNKRSRRCYIFITEKSEKWEFKMKASKKSHVNIITKLLGYQKL